MSLSISLTDNTLEREPVRRRFHLSEDEQVRYIDLLNCYAGVSLQKLKENNPGLLVFPSDFETIKDGIQDRALFDTFYRGGVEYLQTGNIAGMFGLRSKDGRDSLDFQITSRFDHDERQYFLFYLLERIMASHIVDFPAHMNDRDRMVDLAICLFPFYLQKALAKGLFRAYQTFQRNDDMMSGSLDVDCHIATNVPFAGRIAYTVRERSADNSLMQLVRHAIEFIAAGHFASVLSSSQQMCESVLRIREATPSYFRGQRSMVIAQNLKPVRHPYYTEYTALQKLCLMILRREKLSYAEDSVSQANGIIFAVDWLWEEYLAKILATQDWDELLLSHPQNKDSSSGEKVYLFSGNIGPSYPDFMLRPKGEKKPQNEFAILDAKYQRLSSEDGCRQCVPRNDRLQMITYLHVTKAKYGIFLFPKQQGEHIEVSDAEDTSSISLGDGPLKIGNHVNGYCHKEPNDYPEVWIAPFVVPSYDTNTTFVNFCQDMQRAEKDFIESIRQKIRV